MKRYSILLFKFFLVFSSVSTTVFCQHRPVDWVDPLIDTHDSRWFYFSSASRPFGMVNLSPDTKTYGLRSSWRNGYNYNTTKVRCFSHVHAWQLAGIPVMPTTGDFKGHLGMDIYQSSFSHDDEIVKPGYHSLVLEDYSIRAELTSTTRVGFHKYTFPKSDKSHIIFDVGAYLAHGPVKSSEVRKISDTEVVGYSITTAHRNGPDEDAKNNLLRPKDVPVYFVAVFNKPFKKFGGWKDKKLLSDNIASVSGKNAGGYVQFATSDNEVILLKVGISYTSIEQARLNLQTELPHWDFEKVKNESLNEWNDWLGRIEVQGGSDLQKVKFYTDLWHALLGRRTLSDVDGKYCDLTGAKPVVRQVELDKDGKPLYPHLNFDALWGTQWSLNILWSMAYPNVMDWFCNSMLDMYRNGGLIPRGPSGGNYTYVMIGDPATSFFASAYNKGIRNYDVELAYEGLRKNAFPGGIRDYAGYEHDGPASGERNLSNISNTTLSYEHNIPASGGGIGHYVAHGYVPEDLNVRSNHEDGASMTLEYAYQDWCLAQYAKALGKGDDYKLFMKRALNYKSLWNPTLKLTHPRSKDGKWMEGYGLFTGDDFCEGTSLQYSYFVPHDITGLYQLMGSREKFTENLNQLFENSEYRNFVDHNFINYSNQPSTGLAHMFNHSGAPWLSQKWVRMVKDKTFGGTTPFSGYPGDEDQGQMGALGALMSMGLFELRGGAATEPVYEITSPIFDKVTIHLDSDYYPGKKFVIETRNNSSENMYIQSAKLNGKSLNKCWFTHEEFMQGGKLELDLGAEPNKNWGSAIEDAPPSMTPKK
jgi:putative alpha-1,2-mannosidase